MISPFAAFFYAAFNPFLLLLADSPATRWLAGFFLPHMVLPPGFLLQAVRVAGSILFVTGTILFLVCAGQVYVHKFRRLGPVRGGLYRWVRHPQYVALWATGLGLAILWPRFLTIVLWTVMVGLYYLLARDEERRMAAQFGDQYRSYLARTGMFFPKALGSMVGWGLPLPNSPGLRVVFGFRPRCLRGRGRRVRSASLHHRPPSSMDERSCDGACHPARRLGHARASHGGVCWHCPRSRPGWRSIRVPSSCTFSRGTTSCRG